jgi:hypothetical protein
VVSLRPGTCVRGREPEEKGSEPAAIFKDFQIKKI